MSIRSKLIIMFLVIGLLPLCFMGLLTFNNYKRSLEAASYAALEDILGFKIDKIGAFFDTLKDAARIAQDSPNIKRSLPALERLADNPGSPEFAAAREDIDAQLQNTRLILRLAEIILVDVKGRRIYSSGRALSPEKFLQPVSGPDQKAVEAGKDQIYISQIYTDKSFDGGLGIAITAPLRDLNGVYIGNIIFKDDVAPIYRLIQDKSGLGETGETLLARKKGNQVFFMTPRRHEGVLSFPKLVTMGDKQGYAAQQAVEGKNGFGQFIDYRGVKTIGAWQYIPSLGWGIVAKIDTKEAFAEITNLRRLIFALLAIMCALAGIMAVSVAQSIARPIRMLSEGAEKIGSGDLDHRVATDLKDEIGQLSRAFDKMTRDLKRHILERDQAQENVEIERKRLRDLLETLPVYVVLLTPDYHVTFANKFFRERFGEDKGRRCFEYLFQRDKPCENCGTYKVLENNLPHRWEWAGPDGRNYDIYDFPFTEADGSMHIMEMGIDITARKLAETELRRHQENLEALVRERTAQLQIILDSVPASIFYKDRENRFIRVNKAFEDIMGVPKEGLEGKSLFELYPRGQAEAFWKDDLEVIRSGKPKYGIIEQVQTHQGIRLMRTDKTPYFDDHGQLAGIIGFAFDITEQKQAEDELRSLNRILKALSSSDQAMTRATNEMDYLKEECDIIVRDCGYAMVWIGFAEDDENKTVLPVAQAGFEEGYVKSVNITWHDDNERGRGPTGRAIRTGKPAICRNMLSDPDFQPWREEALKRGYASSIVLPLISEGKAFGAVNIYSKLPDPFSEKEIELLVELADSIAYGIIAIRMRRKHRLAEQSLRQTRDYLEKLINYANAPIICWDAEFKITRFNHAFERLTNYAAEEVIGRDLSILFPRDSREESITKIRRALAGEHWEGVEIPILRKEGDIRTALWNSANIHADDGKTLLATIAQGQDITARKRIAEALRQANDELEQRVAQRTEELIKAETELSEKKRLSDIGTLAATVAHELRNPLAAISMAAYNIRRKANNPLLEKHISNIDAKVTESEQIIDNLLFYSRLRMPIFENTDIYEALKDCIDSLRERFAKYDLSLESDIEPLRGKALAVDRLQIKEVFNNVLVNAFDALPGHRGKIKISALIEGGSAIIRIRDNGVGIDKEHLDKVYNPFFTTKAKGTGLGLAVCFQVMRLHGGKIHIESEKGIGTTVALILPKAQA